jgi:hypothetical protein
MQMKMLMEMYCGFVLIADIIHLKIIAGASNDKILKA